jgi:hypothetical protein
MIATWSLLAGAFTRFCRSRRDAILGGSLFFAVMVLAITETLSAAKILYFQPLVLAWITATVLSLLFFVFTARKYKSPARPAHIPRDPILLACVTAIVIIIGIVGLTAIVAPPNNWDSMTYHMARVANWVQHRTVDPYPTQILRQIYLGPWSEYAVANMQILVASDRLANCVQFFAMIGCVIGVSAISAGLGASPRGQAIAGLFAASIPIMILEASNTQTDCVAGLWVVCAINAGLNVSHRNKLGLNSALLSVAVGVAFLTKATTALVLAPFVAWVVFAQSRSKGFAAAMRSLLLLVALPLLINARQFHRNHSVFAAFLVPASEAGWYRNTLHTPGAIASNSLRNLLMNTGFRGMRTFPVDAKNIVRIVSGLDPSDPRITYSGTQFTFSYTRDEHDAGNPIHLLLGATALAATIYNSRRDSRAAVFAACILAGFFLFCFELKWQPWITRLQLPIFVITAPLFGLMIDRIGSTRVSAVLIAILFGHSFIYLLYGAPRTLVGSNTIFNTPRANQYFSKRPDLREPYQQAAEIFTQARPPFVALACKGDSWEYALRSQLPPGTGIIHVGVTNPSNACPSFAPSRRLEYLIDLDNASIPAGYSDYHSVCNRSGIAVLVAR